MTLLHLDSSPRPGSFSRRLSDAFVRGFQEADPEARIIRRDLNATPPPFVDEAWVTNAYLPLEQRTPGALDASDEMTNELLEADVIVLGSPMYNLGLPAVVKAWIDQVVRMGLTFAWGGDGFEGLAGGRTVAALIARNGQFRPGEPAHPMNYQETYLESIFGFIGITDVQTLALQDVFGDNLEPRVLEAEQAARAFGIKVAQERLAARAPSATLS